MTWFGTDIVALGCILGGAAVGGTVTAAMFDGGDHAEARCGVEAFAVRPNISISHRGEGRAVIVTPDVRVHAVRDCVSGVEGVVEIHMENHLQQLDAQLEQLDRALEIQLHELELQLESEVGLEMEARVKFEEAMRQMEEARVRVVIKKNEGGI